MNITAITRDLEIDRATRNELKDIMLEQMNYAASVVNVLLKNKRVEFVKAHRDMLQNKAVAAKKKNEEARLKTIEAEVQNEIMCQAIDSLETGFAKIKNGHLEVLHEIKESIDNVDPTGILWAMENKIYALMYSTKVVEQLVPICCYFRSQLTKQTDTVAQMLEHLEEHARDTLNKCVNNGSFRHNSTCEISNVKNKENFKAVQFTARLLDDAIKAFTKDLACTELKDVGYGAFIRDARRYK